MIDPHRQHVEIPHGLGDAPTTPKPVRDALAFVVWLAGLFQNRIHWRGRDFDVHDGRLIPVASSEP